MTHLAHGGSGYSSPDHDPQESVKPPTVAATATAATARDVAEDKQPLEQMSAAVGPHDRVHEAATPGDVDYEPPLRANQEPRPSESSSRRSSSIRTDAVSASTVSNRYSHNWSRSPSRRRASSPVALSASRRRASSPMALRTLSPGAAYPHQIVGHIQSVTDARLR